MAFEKLTPLEPSQAEPHYCGIVDPAGMATPRSVAQTGQAYRLQTTAGELVFNVTKTASGAMWIEAAAGNGADDLTAAGFEMIEAIAQAAAAHSVGFQTARPGLVRKAQRHGYEVVGWILKKAMP